MYVNETEFIKNILSSGSDINQDTILRRIIADDQSSEVKNVMRMAESYYKGKTEIENKKNTYVANGTEYEEENVTNDKLSTNYYRLLVDQKVNYITKNPISLNVEDERSKQLIDSIVGEQFDNKMQNWVKGASNKGVEWMHFYLDSDGQFKYTIIPANEIYAVYDSEYEDKLEYVIRYYKMVEYNEQTNQKIEYYNISVWTDNEVHYYEYGQDGKYRLKETKAHFYQYNSVNPDEKSGMSWGKVPFVPLLNNDDKLSDLLLAKKQIDNYEKHISKTSDNLSDIQNMIWVVKGYKGKSLAEFMKNLKTYKAILVDVENGGAEAKSAIIPIEAINSHLTRLKDDIFLFGQGVDPRPEKFGSNPTNVAIKSMYNNLDMKAGALIRQMKVSLREFMYFVCKYISVIGEGEYNYRDVNFTFNLAMIVNESEVISNLISSKQAGILSLETTIAKNPYVDDTISELEKIRNDESAYLNGLNDVDTTENYYKEFEASGSVA